MTYELSALYHKRYPLSSVLIMPIAHRFVIAPLSLVCRGLRLPILPSHYACG
jgi:hypothetical protein